MHKHDNCFWRYLTGCGRSEAHNVWESGGIWFLQTMSAESATCWRQCISWKKCVMKMDKNTDKTLIYRNCKIRVYLVNIKVVLVSQNVLRSLERFTSVFYLASSRSSNAQWRNWRGGREPRLGKLNVKTAPPPLSLLLIFSILLVFSRLLFFVFFGLFLCLLASRHPHPDSLSFLNFFSEC